MMSLIARAVPGLAALRSYDRGWLTPDLIAGLTVWAILVPQAMGYASLAGVPAVYGLYTALGALLLHWLWGSGRELNVGPERRLRPERRRPTWCSRPRLRRR